MQIRLLDPFGSVMASGELSVPDVPGIDEFTPSLLDEVRSRFLGQRHPVSVSVPGAHPGALYSIEVSE